jgi:SAM-dependent methyltransferase
MVPEPMAEAHRRAPAVICRRLSRRRRIVDGMVQLLGGIRRLVPRLRNTGRNFGLLVGPDLRQWLYDLSLRIEGEIAALRNDLDRRDEKWQSSIDALRAEPATIIAHSGTMSHEFSEFSAQAGGLGGILRGDYYTRNEATDPAEYWTRHNVTTHHRFATVEDSLAQFEFRNQQYPGYIDLLPVSGKDGLAILDFGCGPGHDLVGFWQFSRPKRLVGVDISHSSLAEATDRLKLHGAHAELVRVDYGSYNLPFDDGEFDYIHCSGVLMCIEDPARLLREFHRLLKPGGELRLMVYNHDSIWLHLYVAYVVQIENGFYSDLPPRVAFTRTTDGEDCPINAIWRPAEMLALGRETGFDAEFIGAAISLWELHTMAKRHFACLHPQLPAESRAFLTNLRFDARGRPLTGDHVAGIDGCFRFRRPH